MGFLRIPAAAVFILFAGAAGVRIDTASVRTGFAMTGYKRDGIFTHFYRSSFYTFCRCRREIAEAPPVADAARRFRGSAPIGGHDSGCRLDGTTVLPRRHSRIFAKGVRVTHFYRSSSYIFCRCRRGRGRSARSSAPGGAAFSRCRRRRRSRRWLWPPARA